MAGMKWKILVINEAGNTGNTGKLQGGTFDCHGTVSLILKMYVNYKINVFFFQSHNLSIILTGSYWYIHTGI